MGDVCASANDDVAFSRWGASNELRLISRVMEGYNEEVRQGRDECFEKSGEKILI